MKPFIPKFLPIKDINWEVLAPLIGNANSSLSLYNGILEAIPNPHILLSPMTIKEAVLSSKIEGTQASLSEVLEFEAGESNINKRNDIDEVMNYRQAMLQAESMFLDRPFIHLNMIKKLHEILLSGVRGKDKARGCFRTEQNWIGPKGTPIELATYIPPSPEHILPLLTNWENYINGDEQETLVQMAFLHAQFELIHPFLDGNGRMGRMLLPLYLYQKHKLKYPVFYFSEYFEKNRDVYYEQLKNISQTGNWQNWVEFFLGAIIEQSGENCRKARNILSLYEQSKIDFRNATHSQFTVDLLDALFKSPITNSSLVQKHSGIPKSVTVSYLLNKLSQSGLISIVRKGRGSIPTIYRFDRLLKITDS